MDGLYKLMNAPCVRWHDVGYSGILPRLLEQTDEAAVDGVEILSSAVRTALMLKIIPIIEPINGLSASTVIFALTTSNPNQQIKPMKLTWPLFP